MANYDSDIEVKAVQDSILVQMRVYQNLKIQSYFWRRNNSETKGKCMKADWFPDHFYLTNLADISLMKNLPSPLRGQNNRVQYRNKFSKSQHVISLSKDASLPSPINAMSSVTLDTLWSPWSHLDPTSTGAKRAHPCLLPGTGNGRWRVTGPEAAKLLIISTYIGDASSKTTNSRHDVFMMSSVRCLHITY